MPKIQRQVHPAFPSGLVPNLTPAAGTEIAEHTSPRNAVVNVIEGQGMLTLEGKEIVLESGVFVFMPAATPHALKAMANLTFLLTLSACSPDSEH